jgi:hypothetical protein
MMEAPCGNMYPAGTSLVTFAFQLLNMIQKFFIGLLLKKDGKGGSNILT